MLVLLARITIRAIESIQSFLGQQRPDDIIEDVKKFTHVEDSDFPSDFGPARKVMRTVPYRVWSLRTTSHELMAADRHIVIREDGTEAYLEDLRVGDRLRTENGSEFVTEVLDLGVYANMFDVEIDHPSHHYYSNGILSHNTTTAAAFLLWWAIFKKNQHVLILSKDHDGAKEVMERIWYAYEELPWWIKPGVKRNQVHTKKFDNDSTIKAIATTPSAGRGKSISLLYMDEFAYVRPSLAEDFWTSIYPVLSCLSGDTMVLTDEGYERIDDLHQNRDVGDYFEIENRQVWGRDGMERLSHGYVSPESDTKVLTTEYQTSVEATLRHPLWSARPSGPKMIKAEDLRVGDFLRLDVGMERFGKTHIDENVAYMLGGYSAEGWTTPKKRPNTVWIANTDPEFRDAYLNANQLASFTISRSQSHKLHAFGYKLIETLQNYGIDVNARAWQKRVPTSIMRGDRATVVHYLAGLFDGDGSVTERSVNLTSTSKMLIDHVRLLLLNLGFIPRTYTLEGGPCEPIHFGKERSPTTTTRTAYSLNIPISQYQRFKDMIPIRIARKCAMLDQVIAHRKQDDYKLYTIPARIIGPTLEKIIAITGQSHHFFRKSGVRTDKVLDGKDRKVTRDWLLRFANLIRDRFPAIHQIYQDFFHEYTVKATWAEIIKVEESTNVTYDFTVPGSHSFLQNGMIGSNTGGKCIVTSTPNTDEDKFAKIWFNSEMSPLSDKWEDAISKRLLRAEEPPQDYTTFFETDLIETEYKDAEGIKEIGDDSADLKFIGFHAHWTSVPEKAHKDKDGRLIVERYRGEEFKKGTLRAGFTEEQFMREYDCLSAKNIIKTRIYGKEIFCTIESLYEFLADRNPNSLNNLLSSVNTLGINFGVTDEAGQNGRTG